MRSSFGGIVWRAFSDGVDSFDSDMSMACTQLWQDRSEMILIISCVNNIHR